MELRKGDADEHCERATRSAFAGEGLRRHKLERVDGSRERTSGMERPVRGRVMKRAGRGAGVPGDLDDM